MTGEGQIRGLGMTSTVDVNAMDAKYEREVEYARKSEQHLWIACIVHRLSDGVAKQIAMTPDGGTPEFIFDHETTMGLEIGCLICEEPLDRRLVGRRCPGEPRPAGSA